MWLPSALPSGRRRKERTSPHMNNSKKNTSQSPSSIHPDKTLQSGPNGEPRSSPTERPLAVLTADELENRYWEAVEHYQIALSRFPDADESEERARLKQQFME